MLSRRSSQSGFTLIETLAAITVFAIMTLGLAPLLAASLRGSTLSRSFTVGKNVAQQAMERVRGLPYFVSGTTKVDVLDVYFPQKGGAGYAAGLYTTTCLSISSSTACPVESVPENHTVTYEAAFVRKADSIDPVEEYEVVEPDDGYSWDTATKPPEPLLRMTITVEWPVNGETQEYQLQSLVGDRRFGGLKLDGLAVVDYGVQILTAFRTAGGQVSELSVVGGTSQSRVESKLLTTADQSQSAANLILTDRTTPIDASLERKGANIIVAAPPDLGPLADSDPAQFLTHSNFGNDVVAGVDSSSYSLVQGSVTSDLPIAKGTQQIRPLSATALLWVDNRPDTGGASPLRLRDEDMVAWVRSDATLPGEGVEVSTEATTSPLATQQLLTRAATEIESFLLLPTEFIADATAEGAVLEVRGFQAAVNCLAKPTTGTASASWEATLRYWQDPPNEDGLDADGDALDVDAASYEEVDLGDPAGAEELEAIQDNPPMVYEDPLDTDPLGSPNDIYLFEPPGATHDHATHVDDDGDPATPVLDDDGADGVDTPVQHDHAAYLSDWTALDLVETDFAEPQLTSASIGGALGITTTQTNSFLESVINVNLGSLSCRALEAR